MSWMEQKEELEKLARSVEPACRLVTKDSRFWLFLDRLLWLLSFGVYPKDKFVECVANGIGPLLVFPRGWSVEVVRKVIPHEARHARQCRWLGLGIHPWLGVPLFLLTYFFLPLPVGLAWCRYRLELDACETGWAHLAADENNPATPSALQQLALSGASRMAGVDYLWAMPRFWTRWGYTRKVDEAYRTGRVMLLRRFQPRPRAARLLPPGE